MEERIVVPLTASKAPITGGMISLGFVGLSMLQSAECKRVLPVRNGVCKAFDSKDLEPPQSFKHPSIRATAASEPPSEKAAVHRRETNSRRAGLSSLERSTTLNAGFSICVLMSVGCEEAPRQTDPPMWPY